MRKVCDYKWIDVHAHIDMLDQGWEEIKKELFLSGVERVINIGTNPEDNHKVLEIAEKNFPLLHCTLGMHPHEAKHYNEAFERFLKKNLHKKEVLAIGEIGLDYYYEHSPREIQKEVFRKQLKLALEYGLPVEIHTRKAEDDTISLLKEYPQVCGLIHCFSGSVSFSQKVLDLGFHISFSGIVTFKKAKEVQEACLKTPLDKLHIETDSPFLAPTPHRGKTNKPSLIVYTAQKVCELKSISLNELSCQTKKNALKLFKKLNWS